eukprot:COSAG05_NODE_364_length_10775_cov_3.222836_3_plen_88_part_00
MFRVCCVQLRIHSKDDPRLDPEIDENMLSDARDVARLRLAADVLFEVSAQAAFRELYPPPLRPVPQSASPLSVATKLSAPHHHHLES